MCQQAGFSLVGSLKGGSFHCMHEDIHPKVVDDVGESPHHRHTEEGDAKQHDVKDSNAKSVGKPDPPTVHDPGVGVHLTVCHTHVHSSLRAEKKHVLSDLGSD